MRRGKPNRSLVRAALGLTVAAWVLSAVAVVAMPVQRYTTTTVPLLSSPGEPAAGQITPGTLVTVAKARGTLVKVVISGWSMAGEETVAFVAPGQRIVIAYLDKRVHRKVIGMVKDAYGDVWRHIQFTAWIAKDALTASVKTVWKRAHALYSRKCSQCHALHQPSEFTANQWPSILAVMTHRAALDDQQRSLVVKYVQMHARDMAAGTGQSSAPAKPADVSRH